MTDFVRKVSEIAKHDVTFKWKIKNFSAQDLLAGAVKSPSFRCCGVNFHLEVSRKLNEILLQLVQSDSDDPPRVSKCSIGFNNSDFTKLEVKDFDETVKHSDIFHVTSVDTLEKDHVANNELSVECQITASILEHTIDDQAETLTANKNMMEDILKVSEIVPRLVNFKWIIRSFSAQDLREGALKSPSFNCCGANFHFELSRKSNEIHLQLVQSPSDDQPRISKCKIGVCLRDPKKFNNMCFTAPVNLTDISYRRSVDIIMKNHVLNNTLSVVCHITVSILKHTVDDQPVTLTASNEKKQSSKQGHTALSENFRSILEDSRFADVTLKIGEDTFQAHKAILSSRSRVFEGMFQSGMKENEESVVEVVEMEPSTLKEMMQYIYAGAIGELSVLEAIDLYVAADRYDLQELKGWCRELILEHISSDLVCRVAVVADLHSDEELAKASKRVFKENSKTIMASESWREFGKQNPAVQTDLLESALLSYWEN